MKQIGILNGPNLNRLGRREPEIYGTETLGDLQTRLEKLALEIPAKLDFFQSNSEGAIIDKIEIWADAGFDGMVLNPGGLTHTSYSLRDAIAGNSLRTVEVHISNIYHRDERQKSITAAACEAVITGMGFAGYDAGLLYLCEKTS